MPDSLICGPYSDLMINFAPSDGQLCDMSSTVYAPGWIFSPGYPDSYTNGTDCSMALTFANPTNGRMVVTVTSQMFAMQETGDYLRFTDDGGAHDFFGTGLGLAQGNNVRCKP